MNFDNVWFIGTLHIYSIDNNQSLFLLCKSATMIRKDTLMPFRNHVQ